VVLDIIFFFIVSLNGLLNIFPFPVTAKLAGNVCNNRQKRSKYISAFAYSFVSLTIEAGILTPLKAKCGKKKNNLLIFFLGAANVSHLA
jgi:hypothetical protein